MGATLLPTLFDQIASRMGTTLIDRDRSTPHVEGNLYAPQGDDRDIEGEQHGKSVSAYTSARLNPLASFGMLAAATALGVAIKIANSRASPPAKRSH